MLSHTSTSATSSSSRGPPRSPLSPLPTPCPTLSLPSPRLARPSPPQARAPLAVRTRLPAGVLHAPPGGVLPAGVLPMRSSTRLGQAAEMPSASSLAPSPVTSATSPRSDSDTIVQLLGCRASTPLFDTPSATRTGLYRFSCPGTERWRRGPRTGVSRPRRRAAAVHVRTLQAPCLCHKEKLILCRGRDSALVHIGTL